MSDLNTILRAPWSPPEGSYEAMVMQFMWDHDHKGYARRLSDLHDDFYLVQAEAGPGHAHCEFTQAKLDRINKEIDEVVREATDRYDDWKTDSLS